ncbi:hypothetical protein [Dongshaea marina]|uniref:hypothetical protein n=1 Tax=Dongshaea marina TaxID=2047966 RepID=UPI000D3E6C46|nr:hypothetical protein [Dongshaea marina]
MDNQIQTETDLPHCSIWNILTERAATRRTIRLSKLAKLAGYPEQSEALIEALHQIRTYCSEQELPTLSAIVVDDEGVHQLSSSLPDAPWVRARVFDFSWEQESALA